MAEHPDPGAGAESEEDDRPWEYAGALRRDCEPDRTLLLSILRIAGVLFGTHSMVSSLLLSFSVMTSDTSQLPIRPQNILLRCVIPVLSGVCSLALCTIVYVLATRDLAEMDHGRRDPVGRAATELFRVHVRNTIVVVFTCLMILAVAQVPRLWD
jgi:hypothetical protein